MAKYHLIKVSLIMYQKTFGKQAFLMLAFSDKDQNNCILLFYDSTQPQTQYKKTGRGTFF